MNFKNFIDELRRRNVFKVAMAYAIAGWLIIQVVATIAPQLNFPNWVPSFITIIVLCGFPLALIFAWAFELTPEGIKKSKEVEITKSVTKSTGKKINRTIIIVLSLAVVFLLIERVFFANSSSDNALDETSIAVLPFADLSPSGDQEYFSDGLSEELLNVLAKVDMLKVAGRTSSFKFKGQNDDLKKIGAELGVNHILEGSVRKSGNQIRVTAQLIKVDDGFHMWSETYDRTYSAENLFAIQDEISQEVLGELKVRLLENELPQMVIPPTENIDAYEALLKGNELIRDREPDDIQKALIEYKKAVNIDPKFARAHARVAIGYSLLQEYGSINRESAADSIRTYSDNALLLDSSLADAYVGVGRYYELKREWDKYREALKKAYDLDPNNPEIMTWYASTIRTFEMGKELPEKKMERLELRKKSYEVDPLSPIILSNLAAEYISNDDIEKGLEYYDLAIEKFPNYSNALSNKLAFFRSEYQDKLDDVFIEAYKAYKKNPDDLEFMHILGQSAFDFGLGHILDEMITSARKLYPDNDRFESLEDLNREIRHDYNEYYENQRKKVALVFTEERLKIWDINTQFYLDVENGKLQESKKTILREWPEYMQDTLTNHPFISRDNINAIYKTNYVVYVLERTDDKKQAEFLRTLPCRLKIQGETVDFKELVEENLFMGNAYSQCLVLYKDYDGLAKVVTDLYDKENFNLLPEFNYFDDITYKEAIEHPKVKPVFDRMANDLASMKENVIDFLKEQDDWPEEYYR